MRVPSFNRVVSLVEGWWALLRSLLKGVDDEIRQSGDKIRHHWVNSVYQVCEWLLSICCAVKQLKRVFWLTHELIFLLQIENLWYVIMLDYNLCLVWRIGFEVMVPKLQELELWELVQEVWYFVQSTMVMAKGHRTKIHQKQPHDREI